MTQIPVGRGRIALVDEADFDRLSSYRWRVNSQGYPITTFRLNATDRRTVKMHRLLLTAPDGMVIDHVNRDKLDNRRANLRFCTVAQNVLNRDWWVGRSPTSPFPGVRWDASRQRAKRWRATIKVDGRERNLGRFATPEEASVAYQSAASLLMERQVAI